MNKGIRKQRIEYRLSYNKPGTEGPGFSQN